MTNKDLDSDGIDAQDAFLASLNGAFGASSQVPERRQRERRAGMTPRQRKPKGREKIKTEQINFRCSASFKSTLATIGEALDLSASDLIEEAVLTLAKARGVKLKGNDDA